LDLRRVALLAGLGLLAFACGEKFTGVDAASGGSSGSAGRGSAGRGPVATAGSAAGGDGTTDGGVDAGGRATTAGSAAGGRGGISSVAGGGGKPSIAGAGGNGGSGGVVVEVPPVPQDGLEAWFSADVGVQEANGVVATWKDRSAHQRDALQTAVNYRPKLNKSALDGKAAIVFDGVDDYLKLPALPGDFSHGVSIFVVAQQDADDGSCSGFFEASNGAEVDDLHLGFWQSALQYEVLDGYLHPTDAALVVGMPQLLAVVHKTTEAVQLRRNSSGVGEANFALPTTVVREDVYIGHTDYSDCKAYPGSVSELLVYSRAVSDAELIDIESYLQAKWACCAE
jgi:hypothetical protein